MICSRVTRSEAARWFPVNFQDLAWETGFPESDPKPLAPAPSALANLNCQMAVLFNFSDKPTYRQLTARILSEWDDHTPRIFAALRRALCRL